MAVTSTKNPREIIYGAGIGSGVNSNGTQPAQQQAATYKPSEQVNQAQQKMQQAQAQKPSEYTQSQQVNQAQQQLQNIQAQKPQGYNSKYGAALDNILAQIQNPEKFKYDFNGDEMFKQYADLYTQKGRQASMNAMGQAAALTGGYGNSYAQQVGNQAYDQYLMDLYAKGDQLRQEAYQRYQDERADQYNQFNALGQADDRDYGRYRDTVGDWERDRGYYTDLYNNERNFDYGRYRDTVGDWERDRGYYTDLYNNEKNFDYSTYQDKRDYDEEVRQFNESLNWDMMSTEQKYAAEYVMQMLAAGQMPTDEQLAAAGLNEEDAAKLMAQPVVAAGGGGGTGGSKGTVYADKNGVFYSYDKSGNPTLVNQNDALSGKYKIDTSQSNKTYGTQALNNQASVNAGSIAAGLLNKNKKKSNT